MAETLFPLDLPPGLFHNGTELQALGRWHDGDHVRFFQGTIQPVGGYSQRPLTGAAVAGEPHAAIAWETNDGTAWLAVATDSNLYVIGSDNVVHDITPAVGFPAGSHRWQLVVYGSYLIAIDSLDAYVDLYGGTPGYANTFYWAGNFTATPVAVQAFDFQGPNPGPISVYGAVVTPERFLMLLRGSDPDGRSSRITVKGTPEIN